MTSESSFCFVFLQLPGSLEVVTCGKYQLERRAGASIGRFVYGRSYRERPDAVPIDPFELPLSTRTYETARLGGLFGALRDASPDAWGRRIIERQLGATPQSELEYLLQSPEDRAGALSFGRSATPPAPVRDYNRIVRLPALLEAARALEEGTVQAAQLEALLHPGSSLGGARPKAVVEDEHGLWIAKFPARGDRWSMGCVEAGLLALAGACGLSAPEARVLEVGGGKVLLVRRFDREVHAGGYLRHRVVSALSVLQADDAATARGRWSYLLLADELGRWVQHPDRDRRELFGRAVFNALVSNLDDHPRNHALVAPGRDWHLSPAYDLTPTPALSRERRDLAMDAGTQGRFANRHNLLSAAARFGLDPLEADGTIDRMKAVVASRWEGQLLAAGASRADCEAVAAAFVYPGFESPP